ncbi:hypothetical protein FPOA_02921 [Fusarium poae]|uniref:Uncharacterized protein n=1 Tax=Fusarium poae TaxID=36050 RepID=A0A1B8B8D0_FUSPO|nr:hypothetical protein FPOA_02921 [Fusarium poae]
MNTLTTNGLPIVSHNDEQRVFGGGWVAFQMQMQIGSVPMGGTAARYIFHSDAGRVDIQSRSDQLANRPGCCTSVWGWTWFIRVANSNDDSPCQYFIFGLQSTVEPLIVAVLDPDLVITDRYEDVGDAYLATACDTCGDSIVYAWWF